MSKTRQKCGPEAAGTTPPIWWMELLAPGRFLEPYLELSIAGTCWSTIRPPDGQTNDLLFPGLNCLLI